MFVEILAWWIIIQLITIGFARGSINNEVKKKTYICPSEDETYSVWFSILLPLMFFLPEDKEVDEYCKKQNN